jgi:cytochrome c peroxidase
MRLYFAIFSSLCCCLVSLVLAFASLRNEYRWELPPGFPLPSVPPDNPMSNDKVKLGRYLFYDKRISANGTESCASCHRQELAFTDGKSVAIGATGQSHTRSAMSLVNVAYSNVLGWSNPNLQTLEEQVLTPLLRDHPVELGFNLHAGEYLKAARSDSIYASLFPRAFPSDTQPFTVRNIAKAIACFERTIISGRSPYDRYHFNGDEKAISESAKRGEVLFFLDLSTSCFRCHSGVSFSDAALAASRAGGRVEFHNTGLYNRPGLLSYPAPNVGIYEYTKRPSDVGKFKAPTLRNIALTAPYMHDGSIQTLEGVLDHYIRGGRKIESGPNPGNGHDNPNKDKLILGFFLSRQNRADLLEFLRSLTDEYIVRDARFSDPWQSKIAAPD